MDQLPFVLIGIGVIFLIKNYEESQKIPLYISNMDAYVDRIECGCLLRRTIISMRNVMKDVVKDPQDQLSRKELSFLLNQFIKANENSLFAQEVRSNADTFMRLISEENERV